MPVRSGIFFRALVRMARAWEKLAVHNGHVDWSNGMPTIVMDNVEGIDLPTGTEEHPHLVWNVSKMIWEVDRIVPDGTSGNPHLVWDDALGEWAIDEILPNGGDSPCVAIWSPEEDAWTALDMGTTPYKVLQLDSAGSPIIDYVRWA